MNSKIESPIDPEGQVLVDCLHRLGEEPAEAYNTVQAVRSMSGINIIHEIRTFGTSIDAKIDSRIDAQDAKIESLRWMLGVVIGLLTLLALLGFFAFVGRAEPVSDPCTHAESQQVLVQPETSASESTEPTSEPPKVRTDGRSDRPAASDESRRAARAQPQEDSLE